MGNANDKVLAKNDLVINHYQKRYFTLNGFDALATRLKTIFAIYTMTPEDKYPVVFKMVGFPNLELHDKIECLGHLNELQQILNVRVYDDGEK